MGQSQSASGEKTGKRCVCVRVCVRVGVRVRVHECEGVWVSE